MMHVLNILMYGFSVSSTVQPVTILEVLYVLSKNARNSITSILFIGLFFVIVSGFVLEIGTVLQFSPCCSQEKFDNCLCDQKYTHCSHAHKDYSIPLMEIHTIIFYYKKKDSDGINNNIPRL
mgnify:CR=1 FL=1